jgi:type IV secretory pathway VirJ component
MKLLALFIMFGGALSAQAFESLDTFGRFGTVHCAYQRKCPSEVVLFISGDGSWTKGVIDMARPLVDMDVLVVGIDIVHYLGRLAASEEKCSYPAADFETLSKFIQKKFSFPEYHVPVIVGYSSGATLAYALIAQAPQGTFKGAISMGFCPDLPLTKPFCKGSGLELTAGQGGKGFNFLPRKDLPVSWIVFQGANDKVCKPKAVREFVKSCGNANVYVLPKVGHGFFVEKNWVPQFKEAFTSIVKINTESPAPRDTMPQKDALNLPLVEVPATSGDRGVFAVFISGDGGWAGIDKAVAQALAKNGISVVGWNSLQYFWKQRTPEEASKDLGRTIAHYKNIWKKDTVVCVGYSFGADVLAFMVNRLAKSESDVIDLIAFLSISKTADFQFHISDWVGGGPSATSMPVLPELEKLKGKKMIYFSGNEEKESLSAALNSTMGKIISLSGGHHFGGHYGSIADSIISELGK